MRPVNTLSIELSTLGHRADPVRPDLEEELPPICGLRGSRGRCWYAYYQYRAEFGEEFSTVAISGILEPSASDPQMRDFVVLKTSEFG